MQPQNSPPALAPRFAKRLTMGFEHRGQAGDVEDLAKAAASSVNLPDVTTKPPAAPLAAITPYNSRTTSTPTLNARHCLH